MTTQVEALPSQNAVQSIVASAQADTSILAANDARRGFAVWNDSTAVLYLLLSNAAASTTVWTVAMAAGSYYEGPFAYTGPVRGYWASVNGNARITAFN